MKLINKLMNNKIRIIVSWSTKRFAKFHKIDFNRILSMTQSDQSILDYKSIDSEAIDSLPLAPCADKCVVL